MQRVVLACLALCVAVAMSNPINSVSIGTQITNARNDQAVLIDVSSDFTDIMNNQHIFQVAVGVTVQQGVVMLNGMRVARSVQSTVSFSALFREIEAGTNNVVNAHNVKVGVQALVQEQIVAGKLTSLSVQLLLSEVDGNLLHQVLVHEVVLFLNPQGAEQSRQSRTMGVAQSAITTTTTSSTTAGPVIGLDPTRSPSDTSSSDSPDEAESHMEKCRVRRFFHWVAKQPFGLRVLIYAALALFAIVVGKFLFCLFTVCCCPRRCPKTRTTYLDNVKLHYVPLSMDDAAYPDKKPLLI